MLASTMHISTNNQPTPTTRHTHHETAAVCAEADVIGAESPKPDACSFRTQQGAKQPVQPHHSPFHAPDRRSGKPY